MGGGANPSKRFYDFEKINKNRQIENIDNTVCNYFEEGDISKIKRECGFRRIK